MNKKSKLIMIICLLMTAMTLFSEHKTRMITDLAGNKVEIPEVKDIQKVIIISPPLVSTFISVIKSTSMLVGIHPGAINSANVEIFDLMVPNKRNISTTFISGFTSNPEEVMKLNPDIILVYGNFQKNGLENIKVPVVDFFISDMDNESWSVKIEMLMREIFDMDKKLTLTNEWNNSKKIVNNTLDKLNKENRKTALVIFSNTGDHISVRGDGSYGDDWLKKSGLINSAVGIKGDNIEVGMEQLLKWDPDIIYIFNGKAASDYLSNSIRGQDWSQFKAFKNKTIFDYPRGMFNWGAPNIDSPLTLIWMTMKNYPGKIDENYFNEYMKSYYKRQYGILLTDKLLESILNPN